MWLIIHVLKFFFKTYPLAMIHMLQKMMMTPDGWMTTVPKAQPLLKYGQLKTIQQSQCL